MSHTIFGTRCRPLLASFAFAGALAAALPAAAQFKPDVHNGPAYGSMVGINAGPIRNREGGAGESAASSVAAIDAGTDGHVAYSAASLGAGTLKADALVRREVPCELGDRSCWTAGTSAHAAMWDTIQLFQVEDNAPIIENTLIPLELSIDGHLHGDAEARFRFYYGDRNFLDLDKLAWYDLAEGVSLYNDIMLVPPVGKQFVYIELWSIALADGVKSQLSHADFGHTLHFNWTLPEGVYAKSASGQFLSQTAAVPEPGAWALMIIGFGVSGAALRRRRALSATA